MVRNRLKELEIKISELAGYLQISRPTMYKFIDLYDSGKKRDVNPSIKRLFDYIERNPLIGKRAVINYILSNMTDLKEVDTDDVNEILKSVKLYVSENPNSEKSQFIKMCTEYSQYDMVIHYLLEISPLIKKRKLNEAEIKKLAPYNEIISIYSNISKEEK